MTKADRDLCGTPVPAVGLGCMNISHAYGIPPPPEVGQAVIRKALDIGVKHFDTAALYGGGRNEALVGPALKAHRKQIFLASKCGMRIQDGTREIDARPAALRGDLETSLRRLQTDFIDLYYLHRWDKNVPIEESIGTMARFVEEGHIGAIGLSEVSASTIQKAQTEHPISAVQSEYSLWSRNVEVAVLDACKALGIALVAFAPVARGFLTGSDVDPASFDDKDVRRPMPRFNEPHFSANLRWLPNYREIARAAQCSPAQLAISWLLNQGSHVHVIPGTTSVDHLEENFAAIHIELNSSVLSDVDALVNQSTVSGPRYPDAVQAEIDTEEFTTS